MLSTEKKIALAEFVSGIGTNIGLLVIPIYLLKIKDGFQIYSLTFIFSTILVLAIGPVVGDLIDRISRRKFIMSVQAGCALLILFSLLLLKVEQYSFLGLMLFSITGSLHYSLHYTARYAYTQSIFASNQYAKFNSAMEITGQVATFMATISGIFLIPYLDLDLVIIFDFLSYFISFLLFRSCPIDTINSLGHKKKDLFANFKTVFEFFKNNLRVFIILLTSYLPFLGVMFLNYVHPVYIVEILNKGIELNSSRSLVFSIGAIIAGVMYRRFLIGKDEELIILKYLILASFSFALIYSFSSITIFLMFCFFVGVSNSTIRVARGTLMMKYVPKDLIGKVNIVFNTLGVLFRLVLIAGASALIKKIGPFKGTLPFISMMLISTLIYIRYFFITDKNFSKEIV